MRRTRVASILLLLLLCAGAAVADNITGVVTNGTTGKPAAGVAVTLVDPMGGMAEIATAKSDAQGRFTFDGSGRTRASAGAGREERRQLFQDAYAGIDKCRSKRV